MSKLYKVIEDKLGYPELLEYTLLNKNPLTKKDIYYISNMYYSKDLNKYLSEYKSIEIFYKRIKYPEHMWDYLECGYFTTTEAAIQAYKETLNRKSIFIDNLKEIK